MKVETDLGIEADEFKRPSPGDTHLQVEVPGEEWFNELMCAVADHKMSPGSAATTLRYFMLELGGERDRHAEVIRRLDLAFRRSNAIMEGARNDAQNSADDLGMKRRDRAKQIPDVMAWLRAMIARRQ